MVLCLVSALLAARLNAVPIVGFDSQRTYYTVSALTGAVNAAAGPSFAIAMSTGPAPGTVLVSSGVNTYRLNVLAGESILYACPTGFCNAGDHAYDSDTGVVFALGVLPGQTATSLFRLTDSGVPEPLPVANTRVGYSLIGALGVDAIHTIEYVPGYGLLSTDGSSLFRIDEATGQATLIGPLAIVLPPAGGVSPITGLAWDPDTRRLLGSSQLAFGLPGGTGQPRLYRIDLDLMLATWLNDSPPSLTGIAAVNGTPEPAAMLLTAFGLLLLVCHRRR